MRTNESAFTPQRKQSFGRLIILIMFLAFVAWLFLRACTNTAPLLPSVSAPTALATVPATPQAQANAQPAAPVATPELHQICLNGICVNHNIGSSKHHVSKDKSNYQPKYQDAICI